MYQLSQQKSVCSITGPDTAARRREHTTEARRQNLRPDGQEPRRPADPRRVPRGQQSGPPHRAGTLPRRRLIDGYPLAGIHIYLRAPPIQLRRVSLFKTTSFSFLLSCPRRVQADLGTCWPVWL